MQYEERAAIMEFDGGMPRKEAERKARVEILMLRDKERAGHDLAAKFQLAVGTGRQKTETLASTAQPEVIE